MDNGPQLLSNLLGQHVEAVNDAIYFPELDAVLTISEDKTFKCWLRRDSGQFWPSISEEFEDALGALHYNSETRTLYLGSNNGDILVYEVDASFNHMKQTTVFRAHRGRVTGFAVVTEDDMLFSVGHDKCLRMHSLSTGRQLGQYHTTAWCTSVQYDTQTKTLFVGDFAGEIHVVPVKEGKFQTSTILQGHEGSIRSLLWDETQKFLFSGSFDKSVRVWDIGGNEGKVYTLKCHSDKVRGLVYSREHKKLISAGDDKKTIVWDLDMESRERQPAAQWDEADSCQLCDTPFFFNVSGMWEKKTVSFARQHHCRKCGKAICSPCSRRSSSLPSMGFENAVRMCNPCFDTITTAMRKPTAQIFRSRHNVTNMSLVPTEKGELRLVTCGKDGTVMLWSIDRLLEGQGEIVNEQTLENEQDEAPTSKATTLTGSAVVYDAAADKDDSDEDVGNLLDLVKAED